MLRTTAIIALGVALCCLASPSRTCAQGSDLLWTDSFTNQPERAWSTQSGSWRILFTGYRGQLTTRRGLYLFEAGVVTPGAAGPTPIIDWVSEVRLRGQPGSQDHLPQILSLRHNVTEDKQAFGLEIGFSSSGPDQIRIVRYSSNYSTVQPYLAYVDTTLDQGIFHTAKFSVRHTPLGVELKAKVWPTPNGGEPEPEQWNLETVSTVVLLGHDFSIGALGTASDPFVFIDDVKVFGDLTPVETTTWGRVKRTFR